MSEEESRRQEFFYICGHGHMRTILESPDINSIILDRFTPPGSLEDGSPLPPVSILTKAPPGTSCVLPPAEIAVFRHFFIEKVNDNTITDMDSLLKQSRLMELERLKTEYRSVEWAGHFSSERSTWEYADFIQGNTMDDQIINKEYNFVDEERERQSRAGQRQWDRNHMGVWDLRTGVNLFNVEAGHDTTTLEIIIMFLRMKYPRAIKLNIVDYTCNDIVIGDDSYYLTESTEIRFPLRAFLRDQGFSKTRGGRNKKCKTRKNKTRKNKHV